jgi:hypothetical protein
VLAHGVYSENLPPPIPIEHGSGAGLVKEWGVDVKAEF